MISLVFAVRLSTIGSIRFRTGCRASCRETTQSLKILLPNALLLRSLHRTRLFILGAKICPLPHTSDPCLQPIIRAVWGTRGPSGSQWATPSSPHGPQRASPLPQIPCPSTTSNTLFATSLHHLANLLSFSNYTYNSRTYSLKMYTLHP
ncbi:hypothetical protein C8Q78DRAFT_1059513 [Trametes maxima]|nr:hypothetical protein C8Q78DRAFT_1059513 [Trametes maxima]